jgi:outer membrane protein OmpA-like peptidoglycan-associated protein
MKSNYLNRLMIVACAMVISVIGTAAVNAQVTPKSVPAGTEVKQMGLIASRTADSFTMKDAATGDLYVVDLTPSTEVRTFKQGVFRGSKQYPATYLLRGLRVEVLGTGSSSGSIAARRVSFNEQDLRTAQALDVRVDPVEGQAAQNAADIATQAENQKKMAGQIEENAALAVAAKGSADAAMNEATRANNRINGLGEYDPIKTIVVPFATGSSTIGPKGKSIIDEAAAWVKTQDRRGWMVEVVGYADSTGRTAANKRLSERRANSVIGYLVSKHNMPLTRLIQPFGAGVDRPAAANDTPEGRAQNRRVEIRLLQNKGIRGDGTTSN